MILITCVSIANMQLFSNVYGEEIKDLNSYSFQVIELTEGVSENNDICEQTSINNIDQETDKLVNYDAIIIDNDAIDKVDLDVAGELLDNGSKIVIYGDNIEVTDMLNIFGEGSTSLSEDSQEDITAVIISASYMGNLEYSYVYNIEAEVTDTFDIESQNSPDIIDGLNDENNDLELNNDMESLIENIEFLLNEEKIVLERIKNTLPENENAYLQLPPNAKFRFLNNTTNIQSGSLIYATIYSPVYVYDNGRASYDNTLRQWILLSYNIYNAKNNYLLDWLGTRLYANYNGQKFVSCSNLKSDSSNGFSLNFPKAGLVYSIATNGLEIDNYSSPNTVEATWKATCDAKHRLNWTPWNTPKNNNITLESQIMIETKNTKRVVYAHRFLQGSFFKQNTLSYTQFSWCIDNTPFHFTFK